MTPFLKLKYYNQITNVVKKVGADTHRLEYLTQIKKKLARNVKIIKWWKIPICIYRGFGLFVLLQAALEREPILLMANTRIGSQTICQFYSIIIKNIIFISRVVDFFDYRIIHYIIFSIINFKNVDIGVISHTYVCS